MGTHSNTRIFLASLLILGLGFFEHSSDNLNAQFHLVSQSSPQQENSRFINFIKSKRGTPSKIKTSSGSNVQQNAQNKTDVLAGINNYPDPDLRRFQLALQRCLFDEPSTPFDDRACPQDQVTGLLEQTCSDTLEEAKNNNVEAYVEQARDYFGRLGLTYEEIYNLDALDVTVFSLFFRDSDSFENHSVYFAFGDQAGNFPIGEDLGGFYYLESNTAELSCSTITNVNPDQHQVKQTINEVNSNFPPRSSTVVSVVDSKAWTGPLPPPDPDQPFNQNIGNGFSGILLEPLFPYNIEFQTNPPLYFNTELTNFYNFSNIESQVDRFRNGILEVPDILSGDVFEWDEDIYGRNVTIEFEYFPAR